MSKLSEEVDFFGLPLMEMAIVRKSDTGLPVNIWIHQKSEGTRKGIRVKVSNLYSNTMDHEKTFYMFYDGGAFVVKGNTGEIKTKDIEAVRKFLTDNLDVLEKHWNKEIDDDDAKAALRARALR